MSLGSELKEAREARKITLEEVSKKTKIPTKYLEALEENRYDVFPSHTYAKGFIRAYAKVVGVDPVKLTRQFNAENEREEIKIEPQNAEAELEKNLGWRPTLSRPPVFRRQDTGDLNLEIVEDEFTDANLRTPSVVRPKRSLFRGGLPRWFSQGVLALAAIVVLAAGVHYGWKMISKIKWGVSKTESTVSEAKGFEPVKVADKYQHLVLKALDKSWVLVTMDDGQSSSESDMDQGEVRTYQAEKNFKVKLGNAGGVDVQFNGKPLGILGVAGQVVEIQLPRIAGNESGEADGKN